MSELRVLTDELEATARAIMSKYPHKRSAALPLLFLVQAVEGYVTEAGMRDVARLLDLTPAEVLATGSFYTMLKKKPQGEYLISVCRNISCTHLGGRSVITALEEELAIPSGGTTADGRFSLEAAECLGTCDGAPALQINYEDFYKVTVEEALDLVASLRQGKEVRSVRGEPVRTSKEVAYETATTGVISPPAVERARLSGGESMPEHMKPGHRPKEGGTDEPVTRHERPEKDTTPLVIETPAGTVPAGVTPTTEELDGPDAAGAEDMREGESGG